jgi:hypothetical protein
MRRVRDSNSRRLEFQAGLGLADRHIATLSPLLIRKGYSMIAGAIVE